MCLAFIRATAPAQVESPEQWSVLRLVEYQQSFRDSIEVQDVYKLLYQSSFGPEHILADTSAAFSSLQGELSSLDTTTHRDKLIERISTSGEMVRVNLRPYKRLSLRPELLARAMIQSARDTHPDTLMFYRDWNEFTALVRYGLLKFPVADVKLWDARVQRGEITPVHHSPAYSRANAPAYRVVRFDVVQVYLPPGTQ